MKELFVKLNYMLNEKIRFSLMEYKYFFEGEYKRVVCYNFIIVEKRYIMLNIGVVIKIIIIYRIIDYRNLYFFNIV